MSKWINYFLKMEEDFFVNLIKVSRSNITFEPVVPLKFFRISFQSYFDISISLYLFVAFYSTRNFI